MIRYIITSVLIAICTVSCLAVENAASVMKHVSDRMSDQPVEAYFAIRAGNNEQTGHVILSGNKFAILSDDLSTWYDGKTQWTLSNTVKEVNVTEPTKEELAEINPLMILSALSSQYNAEIAPAPTGCYVLKLVARNNGSPISSADVTVNASTWFPKEINILTATGERFMITINSIKNLKTVNNSIFKYNPSNHPGVELIDLR